MWKADGFTTLRQNHFYFYDKKKQITGYHDNGRNEQMCAQTKTKTQNTWSKIQDTKFYLFMWYIYGQQLFGYHSNQKKVVSCDIQYPLKSKYQKIF